MECKSIVKEEGKSELTSFAKIVQEHLSTMEPNDPRTMKSQEELAKLDVGGFGIATLRSSLDQANVELSFGRG
ncbi:hypothetical protein GOP47_0026205 [Adiantum capillus-veneris]|nr:hypothetical protein GOP47_0026205 [Adiantum capillus-veneris]